ncbi:hypothetical protein BKA62DRAFT_701004, partial [Auriculariales sp. MPI-PUGE-AT-0066]
MSAVFRALFAIRPTKCASFPHPSQPHRVQVPYSLASHDHVETCLRSSAIYYSTGDLTNARRRRATPSVGGGLD